MRPTSSAVPAATRSSIVQLHAKRTTGWCIYSTAHPNGRSTPLTTSRLQSASARIQSTRRRARIMGSIAPPPCKKRQTCSACIPVCMLPRSRREWSFSDVVYAPVGLFKVLDISPKKIHDWRTHGVLVDKIKTAFYKLPEDSRGGYFPWFLQN